MTSSMPDFTSMIDGLNKVAAQMAAQAAAMQEKLAQAAASARNDLFAMTVQQGQITHLEFSPKAVQSSPTQLRQQLLESFTNLADTANRKAAAVAESAGGPEVAAEVRRTGQALEESYRDRQPDGEDSLTAGEAAGADDIPYERFTTTMEDLLADPSIDDEIIDGATVDELMADVDGWAEFRPKGDPREWEPDKWQQEFHDEIAAMWQQGESLQERVRHVSTEVESRHLRMNLAGGGLLRDCIFRSGWDKLSAETLTAEFHQLYQQGRADLHDQVLTVLQGNSVPDDPTIAMLAAERDAARQSKTGDPTDR